MRIAERDGERQRSSPDALLAASGTSSRGRLKLFLGAAPGVGKTYEMLQTAQARRRDGVDVVVGVVETHGRRETEALLDGLEVVPRRRVPYRGRTLEEMDLDAVLARRPALVLVDELAHTNAPGSRHPKRYLDVEELLSAGIDVLTTVNIQHVESLNDIVVRITRVRVRETLPDDVLDRADDIEVIDLAPDDLIRRLKDGKVYVPEQAARAIEGYFTPGNLTALRELALRRTAQQVDEQLLTHMRAHAIRGPWAAAERVLVCVSEAPTCGALIRHARRLSDRLHAPWTALYVETARTRQLSEVERDRVADCLRLAERLGGEATTLPGRGVADTILDHARTNNVTDILIGKSDRSRWFELLHGSVVHDLVRRSGTISVQVVAGDPELAAADAIPAKTVRTNSRHEAVVWQAYAATAGAVMLALGAGLLLQPLVGLESVDLVFLIPVLGTAIRYGLWPSLAACLAGSLAYNFFFLPPVLTFTIADPTNVAAFVFFTLVAVTTSNLMARVRAQAVTARARARTTEALYAFSRKIAAVATMDDLLWATAHQIASMLRVDVVLLLPDQHGELSVCSGFPPEDTLDAQDLGAARWSWDNNRPAGRGADTLPGAKRLFLPMRTGRGVVGIIGIHRERPGPLLTPDERRQLDAVVDQAAVAVERVRLANDIDEVRVQAETERLRGALLTSLSHDLKTPLASILGAATSLRQYEARYDEAGRRDLVATIEEESLRLNRFVANLLDMTRLESGPLAVERQPVDLGELVATALERTTGLLARHEVALDLADDLPMVPLDVVLFEQVLVNLLENAAKHTAAGSRITVSALQRGAALILRVRDEGPGIPPGELERVFEKFHRVRDGDRRPAGTGLGLAICKGFVEALGGRITAANRSDRSGAVFTIELPVATEHRQVT